MHTIADAALIRRIQERKILHIAEVQCGHLQHHRGQIGAQDLRVGVPGPSVEVCLRVQPDAHSRRCPTGPAGPLRGGGLRNRLNRQSLHLGAATETGDPGGSRVDDIADPGNGKGGLSDVGGQHDSAIQVAGVRGEHPVLFGGGQPRVEREHLGCGHRRAHGLGRVANLAFTGQEHQHVAGGLGGQLLQGVEYRLGLITGFDPDHLMIGIVGVFRRVGDVTAVLRRQFQGAIADLDGKGAPGHLDDGRAAEVVGEPLGLDRCGGDDHLEVRPARQQLAQIAEQEVDVEAAFVGLIKDQSVVAQQLAIALHLGEQDPVGHQLDQRPVAGLVGEPHGVADGATQLDREFVGDPLRHRAGRQPSRLGVTDGAADTPSQFQADLGQLGGLAGTGLAGHHHHLVVANCCREFLAARADRQVRVTDRRHRRGAGGDQFLPCVELGGQTLQLLGADRSAQRLQPPP